MNYDEFAFFNQQLAAMLRDGIPLEGALLQLSSNMRHGALRDEIQRLETDLKNGIPLKQALSVRNLPEFYVHTVMVGQESNDLPEVLLLLADYYRRVDATWTRLKGLMVYPLIVLCAAFTLSLFLTIAFSHILFSNFGEVMGIRFPKFVFVNLWAPPILIGIVLAVFLLVWFVPALRRRLRWRVPAFKEARLAQIGSAMGLMLGNGGNLNDAVGLVQQMERGTVAGAELAHWQVQLAEGRGNFSDATDHRNVFPPLFRWLVSNAGEDLAAGFRRAGEIYQARANQRIEMFLYAALPFAVLALGIMICCQVLPVLQSFVSILNGLSN